MSAVPHSVICILAGAATAFAGGKAESMNWKPESGAVWQQATDLARPVLLEVWADWCTPCRQMDSEVWPDPRVVKASEKFVQVSVDISQRDSSRLGSVMARNLRIPSSPRRTHDCPAGSVGQNSLRA